MAEEKKQRSLATRKSMIKNQQHPASFRDPSGFIFIHEEKFYRQVNQVYAANFDLFIKSGLYNQLVQQKKILPHVELKANLTGQPQWYTTLLPEQLHLITYPYEWCFSQWKDAALLTLDLALTGIEHGMILKDATPFNVQFAGGRPVFIDTLSFEKYDATKPWAAYRQFTECFVAPLLLARYRTPDLMKIFQVYSQGIPVALLSKMLPFRSMFNGNVLLHVVLPGLVGKGRQNKQPPPTVFTQQKLLHIIHNLRSFISGLSLPPAATAWNDYYASTILSAAYANTKMTIVNAWLQESTAKTVLDLGTNTGLFAKAAAAAGKTTIAVDADSACIENLYNTCKEQNISNLLPLMVDIANPPAAIGWCNNERPSFLSRVKPDLVMALALIHHLVIGNNTGFEQIANLLSSLADGLIIEFVPKADPKVQMLLATREDIFTSYTQEDFEKAFSACFDIIKTRPIEGTLRILYLMKRKQQ